MTMYALQRRAKDCGITVSSLHPGIVSINYHFYTVMVLYILRIIKYGST